MDLDELQLEAEEAMDKAVEYLKGELRGVRTGRASTGLVEYIKVDVYGSQSDLRSLAIISVPEPTQLLIKPFDPATVQDIIKAIEKSGLGLNPQSEGKQIRLNLPSLTGDRRTQLIGSVKQMGEQAKINMRNTRRDTNKHIDQISKDKSQSVSEDEIDAAKQEIQEVLKQHETKVDELVEQKTREIQEL